VDPSGGSFRSSRFARAPQAIAMHCLCFHLPIEILITEKQSGKKSPHRTPLAITLFRCLRSFWAVCVNLLRFRLHATSHLTWTICTCAWKWREWSKGRQAFPKKTTSPCGYIGSSLQRSYSCLHCVQASLSVCMKVLSGTSPNFSQLKRNTKHGMQLEPRIILLDGVAPQGPRTFACKQSSFIGFKQSMACQRRPG
jgi:hypothetical protein